MGLIAVVHELREHSFHSLKIIDLLPNAFETRIGHVADFLSLAAFFEAQEFPNLIEGEAQVLGLLDETNAINEADRVTTHGTRTRWNG
jgi:hypothetical protein